MEHLGCRTTFTGASNLVNDASLASVSASDQRHKKTQHSDTESSHLYPTRAPKTTHLSRERGCCRRGAADILRGGGVDDETRSVDGARVQNPAVHSRCLRVRCQCLCSSIPETDVFVADGTCIFLQNSRNGCRVAEFKVEGCGVCFWSPALVLDFLATLDTCMNLVPPEGSVINQEPQLKWSDWSARGSAQRFHEDI